VLAFRAFIAARMHELLRADAALPLASTRRQSTPREHDAMERPDHAAARTPRPGTAPSSVTGQLGP
jgi:hypothetical protein